MYLGVVGGTEALVFTNIHSEPLGMLAHRVVQSREGIQRLSSSQKTEIELAF